MRRTALITAACCLAALAAACAPAPDRAGIDQLRNTYIAAYNAGDVEGLMELWAEDAVWIHQDEAPLEGRDEIRGAYEGAGGPPPGEAELTIEPEETQVGPDWAAEWGTYRFSWTDEASGEEQSMEGRYAALDQKAPDGSWQIARLNTSIAAPPAEPQSYAQAAETNVVFQNDQVIVQRVRFEPGEWVGEHSHAGNQFVVALDGAKTTYREGGEEWTEEKSTGEVFWVEATAAHDHKAGSEGEFLLVTLK